MKMKGSIGIITAKPKCDQAESCESVLELANQTIFGKENGPKFGGAYCSQSVSGDFV